jgi:hypothetical protein
VNAYSGASIPVDGVPGSTVFSAFDAIPGFSNGVYVG